MKIRVPFIAGAALGYVFGTKAGRERYEQIRRASQKVAQNPTVQEKTEVLRTKSNEIAGVAKDKAGSLAGSAKDKVNTKTGQDTAESKPEPGTVTELPGSTTGTGTPASRL